MVDAFNANEDLGSSDTPQPAAASSNSSNSMVGQTGVIRQPDLTDEAKNAAVKQYLANIKADREHWKGNFKRMRFDMKFAAGKNQYHRQQRDDARYLANIVHRHIRTRVSAIYAKNPTPAFKLKPRLRYKIWDEKQATLQMAASTVMQVPGAPPTGMDPATAQMIIAEVTSVREQQIMLTKVGKTAEISLTYFMNEQEPSFKRGMKRMVRRGKTMGVGFVRLGYKRVTGMDPTAEQGLIDSKRRLEHLQSLMADQADGDIEPYAAEQDEIKRDRDAILAMPNIVLREGLQFDWPSPVNVIPHKACTQLDGFVGADWVTVAHYISPARVQEVYKIDIGKNFTAYRADDKGDVKSYTLPTNYDANQSVALACVYEHYHRPSGLMVTLCEGYPGYLTDPVPPSVDLERFYPIYAYMTNETEEEEDIYPPSDVKLLEHIQREYNRKREAARQHRIANRPLYLSPKGALNTSGDEADEKKTIAEHEPHEILEINALAPGQKAEEVIQPMKKVDYNERLYDTEDTFADTLRVVGSQEVDFGGDANNTTATGVAAGQQVKMSDVADDIDQLDMLLSDLFRDAGKILMKEMQVETAMKIAGPGAVWPEQSREQIMDELHLDIVAGSSGKPNQAQQVANLERMTPYLVQIPGINPEWMARIAIGAIDPTVQFSEAFAEGLPSILSINAEMQAKAAAAQGMGAGGQAQPSTGNPQTEPANQGGQGADNAARAPSPNKGPQPAQPSGPPQLRSAPQSAA